MAYVPTINEIKEIASLLSKKLNFDYSNYGLSFMRRRITYIFSQLNIRRLNQFTEGVNNNIFLDDIRYCFPVPCTELFRDPSFWRALTQKLTQYKDIRNLSLWFPELASNEELFSLLIIIENLNLSGKIKVICNIDNAKRKEELLSGYIDIKNRELNKNNMKRLDENLLESKYFTVFENGMIFNKQFLSNVEIIDNHFSKEAPDSNSIFMVVFRNIMLNYNSKLQKDIETNLYDMIEPDGYLSLGLQERISNNSAYYYLQNNEESIYKVIK